MHFKTGMFIDDHDDDTDLLSALIDAFDSDEEVPLAPPEPKQESAPESRSNSEVPDGSSATSPPRESVKVRTEKPGMNLPTADPMRKNDSGEAAEPSPSVKVGLYIQC